MVGQPSTTLTAVCIYLYLGSVATLSLPIHQYLLQHEDITVTVFYTSLIYLSHLSLQSIATEPNTLLPLPPPPFSGARQIDQGEKRCRPGRGVLLYKLLSFYSQSHFTAFNLLSLLIIIYSHITLLLSLSIN